MRPLLTIGTVLLSTAVLAAPASARGDADTIFQAPRELRSADARLRASTLDEIRALGADWLRVVLYWTEVAPDDEAEQVPAFDERDPAHAYDWSRYDRMLREADARGLKLLITVSGPVPRWATRARRDHVTRPSATRFGRFTEAVARRYGDIADAYAIWNEPNHPKYLRPQWTGRRTPTSARVYRRLFQHGERGLRTGGARAVPVLLGETAPRGTSIAVHPLTFLRRTLCLDRRWRRQTGCGALRADGWAHHPYTTQAGPWFRPPDANDVTLGSLDRLDRALARAGRAGAVRRNLPLWLTEFGIQSFPDRIIGVSEQQQAEFLGHAERLTRRLPRVAAVGQYLMRDSDPAPGRVGRAARHPGFETGLRTHRGRAKLALSAFPVPLAALRRPGHTTLWGLVRPATAATRVTVDFRPTPHAAWRPLKHVRTRPDGTWLTTTRPSRSRRYRVRWTDPSGRTLTGPTTRAYAR